MKSPANNNNYRFRRLENRSIVSTRGKVGEWNAVANYFAFLCTFWNRWLYSLKWLSEIFFRKFQFRLIIEKGEVQNIREIYKFVIIIAPKTKRIVVVVVLFLPNWAWIIMSNPSSSQYRKYLWNFSSEPHHHSVPNNEFVWNFF